MMKFNKINLLSLMLLASACSVHLCDAKTVTVKNESKNRVYVRYGVFGETEQAIESEMTGIVNIPDDGYENYGSFVLMDKSKKGLTNFALQRIPTNSVFVVKDTEVIKPVGL